MKHMNVFTSSMGNSLKHQNGKKKNILVQTFSFGSNSLVGKSSGVQIQVLSLNPWPHSFCGD